MNRSHKGGSTAPLQRSSLPLSLWMLCECSTQPRNRPYGREAGIGRGAGINRWGVRMKESYGEDLASPTDPESGTVARKVGREVLTGVCAGGRWSRDIILGSQAANYRKAYPSGTKDNQRICSLLRRKSAIRFARVTPSRTLYICRSASAKTCNSRQSGSASQQRSRARH